MEPIKVIVFSSQPYSPYILNVLKKAKSIKIVKIIEDKKQLDNLNLKETKADVGILAAFGAILQTELLSWPEKGILNIHPSLLPKYRGPSPIQTAFINGDETTGVSIIKLDEQIDHGPIIKQEEVKITENDNSRSLYQKLFTKGAQMIVEILPEYMEGKIKPQVQDHREATYTQKLTKEKGQIDWEKDDQYNQRFINAMHPWPGAWTPIEIKNITKRLKIIKSHLKNNKLAIDKVQLEGKNPVSFKQFQEGYPDAKIKS